MRKATPLLSGTFSGVVAVSVSASMEVSYTIPPEERGWYELSIAIVQTAVDDYRRERKAVLRDERNKGAHIDVLTLRTFFLSNVFENISGVSSPIEFLQRLDEEIERDYERGIRRKRIKKTRVL